MTRDHWIRIAVSHLKGAARQQAINHFLLHPELLARFPTRAVPRPEVTRGIKGKAAPVNMAVRLQAEEYIALRSRAAEFGLSMAGYIKWRCCS